MVKAVEGLLTSDHTPPGHAMRGADGHQLGSKSFVNFGDDDSCTARLHACAALGVLGVYRDGFIFLGIYRDG